MAKEVLVAGLGDRVKDNITGFTGIVIAKTEWLTGCDRLTVQPEQLKDGKKLDPESFDVTQLTVIKKGVVPVNQQKPHEPAPSTQKPGGPRPEPSCASVPTSRR